MNLTAKNIEVLEHLSIYKYLTISMMVSLGVSKHKESIRRILSRFKVGKAKNFIIKKSFPVHYEKGRLEDIYCLSKQGAQFLHEVTGLDIEQMHYAKEHNLFFQDYEHRLNTINVHINLRQTLQEKSFTPLCIESYFDKKGNNKAKDVKNRLRAKTRIDLDDGSFFIPDMIFKYKDHSRDYLFCIEIHQGKDTKRALMQIIQHAQAISEGAVSKQYNYTRDNRVAYFFKEESTKNAVQEAFYENVQLKGLRGHFLFLGLNEKCF